jgi:hypothetical protein
MRDYKLLKKNSGQLVSYEKGLENIIRVTDHKRKIFIMIKRIHIFSLDAS